MESRPSLSLVEESASVLTMSHLAHDAPASGEKLGSDRQMETFAFRAAAILGELPEHARFLFDAIRYLTESGIRGDMVDCGEGDSKNLVMIGSALMTLNDTSRRLVILDVTADPHHRAETDMPLWGSDLVDMLDHRLSGFLTCLEIKERVSDDIVSTGYPVDCVSIARVPVGMRGLSGPIALLHLISDSYPSNKAAVHSLFPRLVQGGIVVVQGARGPRTSQPGCVQHGIDAVEEYLLESGRGPLVWRSSGPFRVAQNA